jgi:hypothetical protein
MFKRPRYCTNRRIRQGSFLWKAVLAVKNPLLAVNPFFILKLMKSVPWGFNKKSIEIELTTRCPLSCFNCDRSVRQAPSDECISVEQITRFVEESIEVNWQWDYIKLFGGEPTLHPQFFEIVDIVKRYKDFNPRCVIEVGSSGYGPSVNQALSRLPDWVRLVNSRKESNINNFISYNIAPIDLEEYKDADFAKGCWVTEFCGMGLTRYGYYPCGAGASVDRVFGFDIGHKKLSSFSDVTLRDQLKTLCRFCGRYKGSYGGKMITEEIITESWRKAYERYMEKKPELSLY